MKKHILALCIGIIFLTSSYTFAADALYRMLHADQVESFKKDQDAMIVGQLIGKQNGLFKVKVLKTLSGKVNADEIWLDADFSYGWKSEMPAQVSDYCVLSLKNTGPVYKKAWGVFKADSSDYKTLKLVPENASAKGLLGELACIQWYVNSGGKENDFSFKESNAYVKRSNGEVVQIYPRKIEYDSVELQTNGEVKPEKAQPKNLYSLIALVLFITSSLLILAARKRG